MEKAYEAKLLPLSNDLIDYTYFLDELIDATTKLEVYKEKVADSKLGSEWFLPTLQQKEALESSKLEGTQATLDGVLTHQAEPTNDDVNINEVINYNRATLKGIHILNREKFSNDFFCEMHAALMEGNVRKPEVIGKYRKPEYMNLDKAEYFCDVEHLNQEGSKLFSPVLAECMTTGKDISYKFFESLEEKYRAIPGRVLGMSYVDGDDDMRDATIVTTQGADFEYEIPLAQMHAELYNNTETVFLMTDPKYSFISSNQVRQVFSLGGDVSFMVDPENLEYMKSIYKKGE